MTQHDADILTELALSYTPEDIEAFIAESGWMDWMAGYQKDPRAPNISKAEAIQIEKVLRFAFNTAHGLPGGKE